MKEQASFFDHLRTCKECRADKVSLSSTAAAYRFCQSGFRLLLAGLFRSNRDAELVAGLREQIGHIKRAVQS